MRPFRARKGSLQDLSTLSAYLRWRSQVSSPLVQTEIAVSSRNTPLIGYTFPNSDSIKPFLEDPVTGPTSRFCAELATNLRCHVIVGYPERLLEEEIGPGVDEWGNDITRVGANSAILFGPGGECVGKYRKTNLYETDTTWAKPGESPHLRIIVCI